MLVNTEKAEIIGSGAVGSFRITGILNKEELLYYSHFKDREIEALRD